LLRGQQDVLERIAASAPLGATLTAVASLAEASFPGAVVSILQLDPATQQLQAGGHGRLPEVLVGQLEQLVPVLPIPLREPPACIGMRILSDDVLGSPLWAGVSELCRAGGLAAAWIEPVRRKADGPQLGLLGIYLAEQGLPCADELEVIELLASLSAIAIERHQANPDSCHDGTQDTLSGLGNKQLLGLRGEELVQAAASAGTPLSMAFITLDRFGRLIKTLGPRRGREALKAVSVQIAEVLADSVLLARVSDEDFVVFLPQGLDDARERLDVLRKSLARAVTPGPLSLPITLSCGLITSDPVAFDCAGSLLQAEEAARRAKSLGGDRCVVIDARQSGLWMRRRLIEQMLADAIEAGDYMNPHLQPIVELPAGNPVGFEVLLRLKDPRLAELPILECIGVAEETGQIHGIGLEVFRHTCELVASRDPRFADLTFNVNVSVRQLMRREFCDEIRTLLARYRVSPKSFCFEVTETHWLDADGVAREVLQEMRSMGFRLALDDFGTGYASIANLQSLPFDTLKVDRRFITGLGTEANGTALCSALLAMGQACGIHVVAEGVETEVQARLLHDLGYRSAQGYRWGRPMKTAAALQWLDRMAQTRPDGVETMIRVSQAV
jgi:diguanylate cyclase (GGDEF)-like protein